MEFATKFKIVSASRKIAKIDKPACVEFEKPYPIMAAYIYMHTESIIIMFSLQMRDDDENFRLGHYELSPTYARVFDNDDITELNANPAKFKLVHRKKDFCDYCYFWILKRSIYFFQNGTYSKISSSCSQQSHSQTSMCGAG
jgi:hypothetical protein